MQPGTDQLYTLVFLPPWIGEYSATLELAISNTLEKNVYMLKGLGLEPAAEDHVVVHCVARSVKTTKISVPNHTGGIIEYSVFTDVSFLSGEAGCLSVP